MYFITLVTAIAAMAMPATAQRAKANEYKDAQCNNWNYGHNGHFLGDVTMDDTTNSVYLTGGWALGRKKWVAYDTKTSNGGKCVGNKLGDLPDGCVNINNVYSPRRVRCVRSEYV